MLRINWELADTLNRGWSILRSMIARRCIWCRFKSITVQLARLSIWIHTFVPGFPFLLDHNLVHGNALVGIGSLDEIKKI